jgi:hypothetical protein
MQDQADAGSKGQLKESTWFGFKKRKSPSAF